MILVSSKRCKVYPTVHDNEVYPSKYQQGNPQYLWWKYEPQNPQGDILLNSDGSINYELYFRWRDSDFRYIVSKITGMQKSDQIS